MYVSCFDTRGGLAIVAIANRLFLNARLFVFKNAWHFKDIFREIEGFLK
jgi:hypothetical protein